MKTTGSVEKEALALAKEYLKQAHRLSEGKNPQIFHPGVWHVHFGDQKPDGRICVCWKAGATQPLAICNDGEHWRHVGEREGRS